MKVLIISNFRDNSGWSFAAQDYALAMDAAGIDVVIRTIKLNPVDGEVHPRIEELEKKSDKNCDVVIQKVLPHMMSYNGNFKKNIGLFVTETSHFKNSSWPSYLNIMDEIIVPSNGCKEACHNSRIIKPVHVIPEPYDDDKFSLGYEPFDLGLPEDNFKFYFIGENIKRKNLVALIQAYHIEFKPWEPVELVIKTSIPGKNEDESEKIINEFINKIKYHLKLYNNLNKYHGETIILGRLSNNDIMKLHAACHCYVAPSYGEAWNRGCFDALAFGNPVLATKGCGMDDYLPQEFRVNSKKVPAIGAIDSFGELLVSNEEWNEIDLLGLMSKMRDVYENYQGWKQIAVNTNLDRFTYKSVGQQIKKILEN
jgi:glycosyltransferase involved in cell wall biosynthesis